MKNIYKLIDVIFGDFSCDDMIFLSKEFSSNEKMLISTICDIKNSNLEINCYNILNFSKCKDQVILFMSIWIEKDKRLPK